MMAAAPPFRRRSFYSRIVLPLCWAFRRAMPLRHLLIVVAALLAALASSRQASAHPHVWIVMKSEVLYAPDGRATGVRQHWAFDDMFSAMATQGLEAKTPGKFTPEELEPLAKVNVESLKEFEYFTYANADGKKTAFGEPLSDYALAYADGYLTLSFTLPFKEPVRAKVLKIEVFDPAIFIDFAFLKENPVSLSGAPAGCKLGVELPRELTFEEGKRLSQIPADQQNTTMAWGANFANKIMVTCP